ncbi:MAG: L-seryl-tRNA(Sec) selenium transferase [Thermoanaerobaculia bacterium]
MSRKPGTTSSRSVGGGTAGVRRPPSMDALLSSEQAREMATRYGREGVKHALRESIAAGATQAEELLESAGASLARRFAPSLRGVVNATGILLHTNLGRAPLSGQAGEALLGVAEGYSTLEHDPETGGRGRRQDHVRGLARALFGAGDALAVNNNAAAVFLALAALARGRGVLISRGELVAIGGSFKIPEILEASGARLVEVGTTNRTALEDYRKALSPDIALLLSVHPSNYEIRGYARRTDPRELATLAREAGIPWLHDQGTGCVVPLDEFGVTGETTVSECLAWGADLVTFSTDKLFSGPQGGLIVGRPDLVAALASHPIARAVRPGKLSLAPLATTLMAWSTGRWRELPIYRAAAESLENLEARAERIRELVEPGDGPSGLAVETVASEAMFGGGTSPEKRLPSRALSVRREGLSADGLAARLRAHPVPVLGRIENGRFLLDLRTILPGQEKTVAQAVRSAATDRMP